MDKLPRLIKMTENKTTGDSMPAIHQWPEGERPREKCLKLGAASLGDAELLAIFLRTGIKGKDAVSLARELLADFGSLKALMSSSEKQFTSHLGLGQAKFVLLQACLEMSRRVLLESLERGNEITSSRASADYIRSQLMTHRQEVFAVLFLDNRHRVIRFEKMFYGTVNGASVHPREVVRRALELNAAALIVAHNHPSGVAEPSHADVQITRRLKEALELVDIRLLDHLVVGDRECLSLAERGQL